MRAHGAAERPGATRIYHLQSREPQATDKPPALPSPGSRPHAVNSWINQSSVAIPARGEIHGGASASRAAESASEAVMVPAGRRSAHVHLPRCGGGLSRRYYRSRGLADDKSLPSITQKCAA